MPSLPHEQSEIQTSCCIKGGLYSSKVIVKFVYRNINRDMGAGDGQHY